MKVVRQNSNGADYWIATAELGGGAWMATGNDIHPVFAQLKAMWNVWVVRFVRDADLRWRLWWR